MPGSLYHSQEYRKIHFVGIDGKPHFELQPIDGDLDVISLNTWEEFKSDCETRGLARQIWPEFQNAFDIPLETVFEQNVELARLFSHLPPEIRSMNRQITVIDRYLSQSQRIFFVLE